MFNPFAPQPDDDDWEDEFGDLQAMRQKAAALNGLQSAKSGSGGPKRAPAGPVFAKGLSAGPKMTPPSGGGGSGGPSMRGAAPAGGSTPPALQPKLGGGLSSGSAGGPAGGLGGTAGSTVAPAAAAAGFAPIFRDKTLLDVFEEGQRQGRSSGGSGRPAFDRKVKSAFGGHQGRNRVNDDERQRKLGGGSGKAKPAKGRAVERFKIAVGQSHIAPGFAGGRLTAAARATALASGAQPAVVKLISTGGGRASVSAMLAYNSRDAAEPVDLQDGSLVLTVEDQKKLLDEWEQDFDKRDPSRDVTTLTVSFGRRLEAEDVAQFREALTEQLDGQRVAIGVGQDDAGNTQLVAVMSVALKERGRMKTTDHARDKLAGGLADALGEAWGEKLASTSYKFAAPAHGVYGVETHLRRAAEAVGTLQGAKDKEITAEKAGDVAKTWRRDLRSYGGRDVMHITMSSRAGTSEIAFKEAVRDFLASEFGNHKYAFAMHGPNDQTKDKRTGQSKATNHVHAHAMIVMKDRDGKRYDPKINDFQRWREIMAFHAQEHGIRMVATRRTENVNAPPFSKGEHEQVKSGKAPPEVVAKVEQKLSGAPVYPSRIEGQMNAANGREAFRGVLNESRAEGNKPVELAAARLAKRYDEAFTAVEVQQVAAQRSNDLTGLAATLHGLGKMLQSNTMETMSMSQRQAMQTAIDRFVETSSKVSESLAKDPALKQSFDKQMKPYMEQIAEYRRDSTDRNRAIRTRTVEAQAEENARAAQITANKEQQAGNALEASRAVDLVRQQRSIASSARGQAELAENAMRNHGETPRVREAAEQVVRTDNIRPDVAAQQTPATPAPTNERKGRKR